ADSRDRALLRPERRGDRGDRRALLARRNAGARRGRRGVTHRARKRFGQHFLEPAWVAKLVTAIAPQPDETFLEIGPGRGALTKMLAPRAGRLIAVEIDRDLAAALPALVPTARVVEGNFLDTDMAALLAGERLPARVAGNLP